MKWTDTTNTSGKIDLCIALIFKYIRAAHRVVNCIWPYFAYICYVKMIKIKRNWINKKQNVNICRIFAACVQCIVCVSAIKQKTAIPKWKHGV